MAAIPNPDAAPESWDTLTLGGQLLPGIVIVKLATKADLEKKKAKGKARASISDNGTPLREPQITWMFDAVKDWARYLQVWPMLQERKAGASRSPLEAVHPMLALHGVSKLLVEEIEGPDIEKMLATVVLKTVEYAPPAPQVRIGTGNNAEKAALYQQYQFLADKLHTLVTIGAPADEIRKVEREGEALRRRIEMPSATAAKNYGPTGNIF
jgi:hypothetical protein